MEIERRSHILSKEPGVLPGSEFFINAAQSENPDILQHLGMCGHYHCETGYKIDRAYYDYIIVAYIKQGRLNIKYDGKEYSATANDIVIMDLKNHHYYAADKHFEFMWIQVSGKVSQQIYEEAYSLFGPVLKSQNYKKIYEKLNSIISSFKTKRYMNTYELSAIIYEIMLHLLPLKKDDDRLTSNEIINLAVEYMKYNVSNKISLDDIAQSTNLSKYYFLRVFKEQTGYTPYDYLQNLRIDTAKHLLSTTDNTVKDIAYSVGYQSQTGFTIAFTEKVGLSPSKYRKYAL